MSTTPEGRVKRQYRQDAEAKGHLIITMSTFNRSGIPDAVEISKEGTTWVEFKSAIGKLSAIQAYQFTQMLKAGAQINLVIAKKDGGSKNIEYQVVHLVDEATIKKYSEGLFYADTKPARIHSSPMPKNKRYKCKVF